MWDDYELEDMQNDNYELAEQWMDLEYEMRNDHSDLEVSLMELQCEIDNDFGHNALEEFLYDEGCYKTEDRNAAQHGRISNTKTEKCGFKVSYDLQQFKPQEVTVKVEGNCVVVKGKRNRRQGEYQFIPLEFHQRCLLPADVDPNKLSSKFSSDGILTIVGPKKASRLPLPTTSRVVPTTCTSAPTVTRMGPQGLVLKKGHTFKKSD